MKRRTFVKTVLGGLGAWFVGDKLLVEKKPEIKQWTSGPPEFNPMFRRNPNNMVYSGYTDPRVWGYPINKGDMWASDKLRGWNGKEWIIL